MDSHPYISFTLSLIESSGPFGRVGSPKLFCWASAAPFPSGSPDNGRVVVLSRDSSTGDWREYAGTLSVEQSRKIIELLDALGLPGRTPDVEGVFDTSDYWSHISFEVRVEGRHTNLEIMMHASGFEGRDAARLNGLFLYLFNLAGYEGYGWSFNSDS
jgi:hypothetical protein